MAAICVARVRVAVSLLGLGMLLVAVTSEALLGAVYPRIQVRIRRADPRAARNVPALRNMVGAVLERRFERIGRSCLVTVDRASGKSVHGISIEMAGTGTGRLLPVEFQALKVSLLVGKLGDQLQAKKLSADTVQMERFDATLKGKSLIAVSRAQSFRITKCLVLEEGEYVRLTGWKSGIGARSREAFVKAHALDLKLDRRRGTLRNDTGKRLLFVRGELPGLFPGRVVETFCDLYPASGGEAGVRCAFAVLGGYERGPVVTALIEGELARWLARVHRRFDEAFLIRSFFQRVDLVRGGIRLRGCGLMRLNEDFYRIAADEKLQAHRAGLELNPCR